KQVDVVTFDKEAKMATPSQDRVPAGLAAAPALARLPGPDTSRPDLSRPDSLLGLAARLKTWTRRIALGVGAQAVSTVANFAFVILVARLIGASAFGEYSVAWSLVTLVDTLVISFIGSNTPALMHRLRERFWPQFRSALCIWSAVASGAFCMVTVAATLC